MKIFFLMPVPLMQNLGRRYRVDFTRSVEIAWGNAQLTWKGERAVMICGDYDQNGLVNNQDFNLWKKEGDAVDVYYSFDGDGNGIINNLDFNL